MKTAISLPDDLFAEADRLARRLAKTRSQLYREAVEEYLARHDPDEITRAVDRVAERLDPRDDGFARAAARITMGREHW
ncbi:MAG TPA: ribbon-helix-helix protein, CopG family [Anaeromyxobacteraceae bacterium]|nr:ribbon-helix-helix protein, CopG family [Anaeromyxobacteraceae bacterium]